MAKDLELYEIAYKIVSYANHYRFKTFDYCNRDYCSSINVFAELELFVHEKKNLGWIIDGININCLERINLLYYCSIVI